MVMRARVTLRREGSQERWLLQLTIDGEAPRAVAPAGGVVGVDIGWRQHEDGSFRVACWASADGLDKGELVLSAVDVAALRKPAEIRARRDREFDSVRVALAPLLVGAPEWLATATATMPQWKSQARLAAVVRRWRKERYARDEKAYEIAEAWRYHDQHLWDWECAQRNQSLRHRREVYRRWAFDLARRYETVVIEDRVDDGGKAMDLRPFARYPETEQGGVVPVEMIDLHRSNRFLCAPSQARDALRDAVCARAGRLVKRAVERTTTTCWECGVVQKDMHPEEAIDYTCEACGVTWDQDLNAAINLCERYLAAPDPVPARGANPAKYEGRFVRRRREAVEKKEKRRTARKVSAKVA